MARYMGGPRGRCEHSPTSRVPSSPTNEENTTSTDEEDDVIDSEYYEAANDQNDSGPLPNVQIRDSIQVEGDDDEQYVQDGAYSDSREKSETEGSENDEIDVDDITPPRLPGQHRQVHGAPSEAPLFPRLPVSSRNTDDADHDGDLSVPTDGHNGRLRQRQRKLTPGIDIEYPKPKRSGKFIFEPLPLPISYGWMVKGTKEHVEDLHLSGVLFCHNEVYSKRTIEVLCEYTWIQPTPSHDKTGDAFPAIYVPGNTRSWQGLKLGSSLNQADLCTAISRTIRDEHAFLQPQYPYEPTFRALEAANAELSFRDVDIITDADTLTRLLAFICGPGGSRKPTTQPFRLDLCTVRDTLFVLPKEKPGRGHAGPLPKRERSNPMNTVPEWAAHVLGRKGSNDPRLPHSGGHYRLIRYRFGDVTLAVRVKVDFVYEHRTTPTRSSCDPLYGGVTAEIMSASALADGIFNWKTTVKSQGLGTNPGAAGMATVRYTFQNQKAKLNDMMPQLWFSRTPFLVEGVVAYPTLQIKDASLINSQQYYEPFERGHRCSLRHLAGLLRHLQARTCELGGNAVMICDPTQVCFVILKPVIDTMPVPEDVVLKFWGPDDDSFHASEGEMASAPDPESDLTEFSKTPTPPQGSDLLDTGKAQAHKSPKTTAMFDKVVANGCPTKSNHQQVGGIGTVNMVGGWEVNMQQSVKDEGYEPDIEDNTSHPLAGGNDGYTTDDDEVDNDIIIAESAYEESCRLSASNGEKSFEDGGQENDGEGLIVGGHYQQETLSDDLNSFRRENSDKDYSGDFSNQLHYRYAIDIPHSDDPDMERMAVKDTDKYEASGDNGTIVVGAHQGRRRSAPDESNSLDLDGAATPGLEYRHRPRSNEGNPATATNPPHLHHPSFPKFQSVGSDTEVHGAATPYMD